MGCIASNDKDDARRIPMLLFFYHQGDERQKSYCIKVKENFKHEQTIGFEIKEIPGEFNISFKVKGKVHSLQETFDDSEEAMKATLTKAYDLLSK